MGGKASADWKNQYRHALDWISVGIGVLLMALYAYLWWTNAGPRYWGMALLFLVWLVVYFSDYWQPILYVALSVVVVSYTVFWLVSWVWREPLAMVAIVLNLAFVSIALYLFVHEEPAL